MTGTVIWRTIPSEIVSYTFLPGMDSPGVTKASCHFHSASKRQADSSGERPSAESVRLGANCGLETKSEGIHQVACASSRTLRTARRSCKDWQVAGTQPILTKGPDNTRGQQASACRDEGPEDAECLGHPHTQTRSPMFASSGLERLHLPEGKPLATCPRSLRVWPS